MHRIHVRTGVVEVPAVYDTDELPTHDIFVIPTGPGEDIKEIEVFDVGFAPLEVDSETGARQHRRRKKRWRFRAVSVEQVDGPLESDVVIEYEDLDRAVKDRSITETARNLLGRGS